MVNYIWIGDNELPVSFSMRALNQFCVKHQLTIGGLTRMFGTEDDPNGIQLTFQQVADLLYEALKEGHRKEQKKTPYKDADAVFELFDEKQGLFQEVLQLFASSLQKTLMGDNEKNDKAPKAKTKAEGAK